MRTAPAVEFRVDQPVQHDGVACRARPLEPEGAEERELLAPRLGRPQGEGARDDAEVLAAGERPEEGRALDDGELDRLAVPEGGDEPEAREAESPTVAGTLRRPNSKRLRS